ncbi:HDOD domain-containing protein [uncultured Aquabacterium sp.]|uniref:serine/threonine protein kinase n=1 Tax=uncultured Aquabacterium sp. TaxID=158753 RepID=UPI002639BAFA|nr:HDOD domain-containing protein [uncultured Aquabacterium sp.]
MALAPPSAQPASRQFGRFELHQMVGRSLASSTWLARDPRLQHEILLCVPRARPATATERDTWTQDALMAARLKHPRLVDVLEVGVHDGWPFVACERPKGAMTLAERLQSGPALAVLEVAHWMADVVEGLAYAHEAGVAHFDIGLHNVLVEPSGHAGLFGLSVGLAAAAPGAPAKAQWSRTQVRVAAERDVLMCGLLMHRLLAGHPALDDADMGSAAGRVGPEIVRLPWTTPSPVPDTLRAIVNRATDRQQRQRYLNARTLLSALQGWIKTNSQDAAGPLALLLDRLNSVGSLPARPGTDRSLQTALGSMEGLRVDDLVDVVTRNPALAWELLRAVNNAVYRGRSADEGVGTLSRAIVLLGQQGLRRVGGTVRTWPGALQAQASLQENTQAIDALKVALRQASLAGHMARLLRPFNVSDEEAFMAACSQKLGWLLILYHFPDEAAQVTRLMQPGPPPEAGAAPTPGMTQDAATSAVLGINLDDLTGEVMRHWGLHDRLVQAARPLPRGALVRRPSGPEETLRTVASLANELADARLSPGPRGATALHQAATRYARALDVTAKECQQVLEQSDRLVDAGLTAASVSPA